MIQKSLFRSVLHAVGSCVVTAWLLSSSTSPLQAYYEQPCRDLAGACAARCGTEYDEYIAWSFWDPYKDWQPQCIWDVQNETWIGCWIPGWQDVYGWTLGSGVESFECEDAYPEGSICACRYR
jgi:hypothetical protein